MERECPNCHSKNHAKEPFCNDCGLDFSKSQVTPVSRQTAPDGKADVFGNPVMVLLPGTILKGKYSINYLTAGGMGAIYLAVNINTNEQFVIKEAYSVDLQKREEFIIALTRERETLIRLKHPGIVKAMDFFVEKDAYYLVMEYIEGKSLEKYQESLSLSEIDQDKVVNWGIQLCEILTYLHNLSPPLIYRDLKPNNILLTPEENIKLIDFGIARVFKEEALKDTTPFGTHGFAAPEQYGTSQTDIRSDIYSLGATLHYLLTSRDPRESLNLFIFPPVREINPAVSSELEETICKAIQIDQEKRYSSAKEMEETLNGLKAGISVKPGFFKFGEIERGTKKKFELKIMSVGKGQLRGEISLPDSFPGLTANKKTFIGDAIIEFQIDTSLLKVGENYRDNIVIFSSGGNSYIPISFEIEKYASKEEEPVEKKDTSKHAGENKWKTQIVDIAPIPPELSRDKLSPFKNVKKYGFIFVISLFCLIALSLSGMFLGKYIYNDYHEKFLKKLSLTTLSGCRICFVAEGENQGLDGSYDIFSVNPDGTGLKNLTKNISWDCFPAWSPAENKIVFSSNRNGFYKIYSMNDDGSNPTRLTRDALDATCPTWSPDGKKIAYQCFYNGNYEIFTMKSDGTRAVNITRNESGDFAPSWSHDGKIAFESKRDNQKDASGVVTREIYIMKSDGSNPVRLTYNSYDDFSPSWSPDSTRLVFVSNIGDNYDIFIINADGSGLFNVTHSSQEENYPRWCPGGKKILYAYYRKDGWSKMLGIESKWEIHAINTDGTDQIKLMDSAGKEMDVKFPKK